MRWTKEEKLKMVLEYKNNGFTPIVEGCSKKTMYRRIITWAKVYDLYGESGLEHRSRHWTYEDKANAVQRVLDGEPYHEVAHSLGMSTVTQITTWHRKYLELGWDSLKLDGRDRKREMGSNPTASDADAFTVLDKDIDKKRGIGAIICTGEYKLKLRENLYSLPIEYI